MRLLFIGFILFSSFLSYELKALGFNKIAQIEKCLILIEGQDIFSLGGQSFGNFKTVGLIMDSKKGIVLISRDSWPLGPTTFKGKFGSFDEQNLSKIYFDPVHSFGFLRYDPKKLSKKPKCKLKIQRKFSSLKKGQKLYFVGKNQDGDLLTSSGEINDLFYSPGTRLSSSRYQDYNSFFLRTSTLVRGSERGGVHLNKNGEIVSFRISHGYRNKRTRYERVDLPIQHILPSFKLISQAKVPARGYLGLDLSLIKLLEAKKLGLPEKTLKSLEKLSGSEKRLWRVNSMISLTEATKLFEIGDLILKVNGKLLKQGFIGFENLIDKNIGKTIKLEILRNGKIINLEAKVNNFKDQMVKMFLSFAGGVFHPPTWETKRIYKLENNQGVFLSYQFYGSPIHMYGPNPGVLITKINGEKVNDIMQLMKVFAKLSEQESVLVTFSRLDRNKQKTSPLKVDTRFFGLRTFKLKDSDTLSPFWEEQ